MIEKILINHDELVNSRDQRTYEKILRVRAKEHVRNEHVKGV